MYEYYSAMGATTGEVRHYNPQFSLKQAALEPGCEFHCNSLNE